MKNISIFQDKDVSSVKQAAIKMLEKCLVKNKNSKILLLLSGGSAFSLLSLNKKCLNSNVTVGMLDERYSDDPQINNFFQLSLTSFFAIAKKSGCKFIDTKVNEKESIQDLAFRFEKQLRLWKDRNPNGKIIITQGMGSDGHTAGIMPYPENKRLFDKLFETEDKWVVDYDAGKKNSYPLRITTTIPFIKLIDISIMYVVGKEKANVLKKALSENISHNIFPIAVVKEMKSVFLFTDVKIN
ncbi:MAG: 6-phosphogluconolactonase [Patescibacteria group bacterium]|jgi:6-phosphogluconolactonase/glucosamine-6-phosphate isomerase/deaminase